MAKRLHPFGFTRAAAARGRSRAGWAILAGTGLAAAALSNRRLAQRAERDHPPMGSFVEVDGLRLHYVDRGRGEPLVLLHGNGSSVEDFACSGLIDLAAADRRVIAFDRPGFGHSERPRTTVWTHLAQADLIFRAMEKIGVGRATVLGHSWGCSVALALAERHPQVVEALVLASGYYFPSVRSDVFVMSAPAIPVVGDLLRHTLSPIAGRLMWPALLAKVFGPEEVPAKFQGFPMELALRPSQIRASAADSALMIPDAIEAAPRYAAITTPTVIVTGTQDGIVDPSAQSVRLRDVMPNAVLRRIPGAGHMIHQTATRAILEIIREAATLRSRRRAEADV